jgi:hypothetical protein
MESSPLLCLLVAIGVFVVLFGALAWLDHRGGPP